MKAIVDVALARAAARSVPDDVAALKALGLIERDETGCVCVPFDAVQIHMEPAAAV